MSPAPNTPRSDFDDVVVTIDGHAVRDKALVLVLCHDGWLVLATCPNAETGLELSAQQATQCLREVAETIDRNPNGDFSLPRTAGGAKG